MRIVDDLSESGYQGVIALEVVNIGWMNLDRIDVLGETVRLRDYLRGLL